MILQMRFFHFLSLIFLLPLLQVVHGIPAKIVPSQIDDEGVSLRWTYDQWQDWPKEFPSCGGKEQSPIDLPNARSVPANRRGSNKGFEFKVNAVAGVEQDVLGGTEWDGNTPSYATINKNGTVFSLKVAPDVATLQVDGTPLTYHMINLHIHTPSEHTVLGQRYPVELHMVHVVDLPNGDELEAVVGVLLQGATDADQRLIMPAADDFMNEFALAGTTGAHGQKIAISLNNFGLELQTLAWERYRGSLTTPPCSQGVHWVVAEPVYIRKDTTDWLRLDMGFNNSRPIQPLNGRSIYKSAVFINPDSTSSTPAPTPAPSTSFLDSKVGLAVVVGIILLLFILIVSVFVFKMHQSKLHHQKEVQAGKEVELQIDIRKQQKESLRQDDGH